MKINEQPQATEIEKSVLASLFLHPENRAEALETLTIKDFYHSSHQILFTKIKELHEAGNPVGIDTVYAGLSDDQKSKLKDASYLAGLLDLTPSSVDLKYHIGILKDRRARRRTIELINSIEKQCFKGNGDLSAILNDTQRIADECQNAESAKTCDQDICCISLDEIYSEVIERNPIVENFIYEGDQVVIHAAGGVGKSLIMQDVAMALAAKKATLWDMFLIPQRRITLFVQSENSKIAINNRVFMKCDGDPDYIEGLPGIFLVPSYGNIQTAGSVADRAFRQKIINFAKRTEAKYDVKIDLIVFDPLISYHDSDENDNARMRTTLDFMLLIANEIVATPIVIHHDNRQGEIRGAKSIWDWARNIIKLEQADYRGRKQIKVTHEKANNTPLFETFMLTMDENLNFTGRGLVESVPDKRLAYSVKVAEALELLGGSVESKAKLILQYKELTGVKADTTVHRHIDNAVELGFIKREYYGGKEMQKARYFTREKPE